MRFMIMVLTTPEADQAARLPSTEEFVEMGKYQEEMVRAGVLMAGEGLRPTALGARVRFVGGGERPQVVDGPFTESKELIAGYSILQVRSKAEAIEWAARAPFPAGTQLEIRQLFEDDDFAASDPTGELRAQDEKRRQEYVRKA
ncbi:MAG: dehydrogenase [Acidobacteriota bacterium]